VFIFCFIDSVKTGMSKKSILSFLALGYASFSFSQTFMHGIGVNLVMQSLSGYTERPVMSMLYSPKLSFYEKDHSSISIGLPISLGYVGLYTSPGTNQNNTTIGWMLDAPLIINFNYGAGSNKKTDSRFGFFGGAGSGYHANPYNSDNSSNAFFWESGFGPEFNTGIRITIDRKHNIEIRFSYMKAMDESKSNIYGIGAIFNY
jgi:hypothetical protein